MNAVVLLGSLVLAFTALIMLTKKEQDLKEDPSEVEKLLHDTHHALVQAKGFVEKDKVPHRVMDALDASLCKLMCNVRADKKEATQISMLYGHFKHVLDDFLLATVHSDEYAEQKKHIEAQYNHIHHELAAVAQRRGLVLAEAH